MGVIFYMYNKKQIQYCPMFQWFSLVSLIDSLILTFFFNFFADRSSNFLHKSQVSGTANDRGWFSFLLQQKWSPDVSEQITDDGDRPEVRASF